MSNSFFISNTSTKFKISFSIAGMIILWGSIFALKKYTPDLNLHEDPRILYYAILVILISAMGSLLGVIMILSHLNYKNKINQFILFLLMGINEETRWSSKSNERVATQFEVTPTEYLAFAENDLESKDLRGLINALSNTKRALDCQIDSLLYTFGLYGYAKRKN